MSDEMRVASCDEPGEAGSSLPRGASGDGSNSSEPTSGADPDGTRGVAPGDGGPLAVSRWPFAVVPERGFVLYGLNGESWTLKECRRCLTLRIEADTSCRNCAIRDEQIDQVMFR